MKRLLLIVLGLLLLVPAIIVARQDAPPLRVEISGINPTRFPTFLVTTNVFDLVGQPVFGLSAENFSLQGPLADRARIVRVENITDDQLPIAVVLAIDTSTSMDGLPITLAKEAAASFINAIGPEDSVAIVAFDTTERLVQDFTTDRGVLLSVIENLNWGGQTALYDGSLLAVETAAQSPSPRRAVIILSDGAEYGGRSSSGRGDALQQGLIRGVPAYTIGLGFGADRSFLEELAHGTLARFNESPTPDQLLDIYTRLADRLRSQYVLTLETDIPGDGQVYDLTVQATDTDGNAALATAALRAPIPVPIVSLTDLPTAPITEPTTITADVKADDAITSAEFQFAGASLGPVAEPPYTVTIDPVTMAPGSYDLSFTAADSSGDISVVTGQVQIAALPSVVAIVGLPAGEIGEPQNITLDISGQTPPVSASYALDGGSPVVVQDVPFPFTIEPYALAAGDHQLAVAVENEGGAVTTVKQTFTVAALPPVFTISGLEVGQLVSEPVTVSVQTERSQAPLGDLQVQVGEELNSTVPAEPAASLVIDPVDFQPGRKTLTVTVTDQNGQSAQQSIAFQVVALPPVVTIEGLTAGESLDADRVVTVNATSQTPVTSVTFTLDGQEAASASSVPADFVLDVLALGPAGHILSVEVTNAGGESTATDLAFLVSEGVSLTATAAVPTSTTVPTNTPVPSQTPVPSDTAVVPTVTAVVVEVTALPPTEAIDVQATADALALTATQETIAQLNLMMTQQSVSMASARATTDAETTAAAAQTVVAEAQAATATARAMAGLSADASATAAAQTVVAEAQAATATARAIASLSARATGTAAALSAAATQAAVEAAATGTAQVLAGLSADASATATALSAAATQASADASATATALSASATQAAADARATADANATETAQAALVTEEPTGEATIEATPEIAPSAEATAEVTEVVTEEQPTMVALAQGTPTGAPTETVGRTPEATFTPVQLTSETQPGASGNDTLMPVLAIGGIGLLVLLLLFFLSRRRGEQDRRERR